MEPTALVQFLQDAVPGAQIETWPGQALHTPLRVSRDALVPVCRVLRDDPSLRFTCLADIAGVDYWPKEPRFAVIYTLVSIEHRLRVRVRVRLQGEDAWVGTVTGVWP